MALEMLAVLALISIACGENRAPTSVLQPTPAVSPPESSTPPLPPSTSPVPIASTPTPVPALTTLLQPRSCELESTLRSGPSLVATSINFENHTTQMVKVYWLDREGKRRPYSAILPGVGIEHPTYKGHPWLVANPAGECLDIYLPGEVQGRAIIVSNGDR